MLCYNSEEKNSILLWLVQANNCSFAVRFFRVCVCLCVQRRGLHIFEQVLYLQWAVKKNLIVSFIQFRSLVL